MPFRAPEAIERRSAKALALRLGANESAFGPSPLALKAMREAAAQVNWYGDPESYELRTTLAARHGVGMENVVIGCGIDDLMEILVRTLPRTHPDGGDLGSAAIRLSIAGYGGKLERVPIMTATTICPGWPRRRPLERASSIWRTRQPQWLMGHSGGRSAPCRGAAGRLLLLPTRRIATSRRRMPCRPWM